MSIHVFIGNKRLPARNYQKDAFNDLMSSNENSLTYNKDGYKFVLQKIENYPSYAKITREDNTSFLITNDNSVYGTSPQFPNARQSSSNFKEGKVQIATEDFEVYYASNVVKIKTGSTYYTNNDDNVLIGWHGTYDPPSGMDGE